MFSQFSNHFNDYIAENHLFTKEDKLLVAVSGGVDSMVLLCLLWKNGYNFGVAHGNFQLRGEASDADERFVELFAAYITPHFHKKRFDTEGSVLAQKKSIQETARDLRYAWFEELRQTFDYQYILTAHHASDSVETVLFNLTRGTGLMGLTGIKPKNGYVMRPLLFASKTTILAYAQHYKIPFREDASNETNKYSRNLIRHLIIPEFKKINPEFENTVLNTIKTLNDAQNLLDYAINSMRTTLLKTNKNQTLIDIIKLKELPANTTVLWALIKAFGFNSQQVETIISTHTIGAKFYSKTHELLIDRSHFIIQTIDNQQDILNFKKLSANTEGSYFYIFEETFDATKTLSFNIPLITNELTTLNNAQLIIHKSIELNPLINKDKHIAQLNYDQLIFPLKLRHWHIGDRFQPLGMNGKSQLVSDYFQQQKLSEFDKKQVLILENGDGRICWIVGFRLAEPFKLLQKTKEILTIKYEKER